MLHRQQIKLLFEKNVSMILKCIISNLTKFETISFEIVTDNKQEIQYICINV